MRGRGSTSWTERWQVRRAALAVAALCDIWIGTGTVFAAPAQTPSVREPVLKQIALPHSYYWREMYLPQLTSGPSSVAWSPDGNSLVYSMKGSLWRQQIGSDTAVELTHGPGYDYQPDWSPDGRSIVFVRHAGDAINLVRLDLASGREQALTDLKVSHLEPRFSPDGRRLVFVSTRDSGHFNLFVAEIDAAGLHDIRPLVAGRTSQLDRYYYAAADHAINPSWSPDGRRVLYVGNAEVAWGSGDLWSVAVDDPADRVKVLTEETTWSAHPELAHDGKRLLYASYAGRQWHQLWLTTLTGQSPLPLTFGEFDRRMARWSPDDRRIAYVSNEGGTLSLWVQTVVGGARQQIVARQRQWRQPMATRTLRLVDDAGAPLAGRVSLLASDGRYYGPDGAMMHGDDNFDRAVQTQETRYVHCPQVCTVEVPAGPVTVTALHGFAHRPVVRRLDGATTTADLVLARDPLPARFGSYLSADLHVHMNYGGHYRQTAETLAAQAAAEDLDIVYNLLVNKEQRIPDIGEFTPAARQFGGVTLYEGQEFHTSYWGHLGLIHLDDHILTPDFASYRHTAMASPYPSNDVITRLAHEQGALVGYVHPFDWAIDPVREKQLSHALPADVAHGLTDYLEIVSFADHHATAGVWYRLLNLGFRLAAGAGTDAMTNYASLRGPVGLNRVYLDTTSRAPTALKAAIKGGHGFATNGPLLGLLVDGRKPGDTLALPATGGQVTVDVALRSIVPVDRWELVWNGRVIRTLKPGRDGRSGEQRVVLPVDGSGWLLVRAYNTRPNPLVQDLYPYATTNPVWIEVAGKPMRSPADARYFVAWLDRVIADATGRAQDYNTPAERDAVLSGLRSARAIYEGLAHE